MTRQAWSITALVLATACASATTDAGSAAPRNAAQQQFELALRVADALAGSELALANLWPGFWSRNFAYAVYPYCGETLVIWPASDREAPGVPLAASEVPTRLRGRAFRMSGAVGPVVSFDLNYFVLGKAIPAVSVAPPLTSYQPDSYAGVAWANDSLGSTIGFVVHESFHAYQRDAFSPLPGHISVFADITEVRRRAGVLHSSAVQNALGNERRMLAQALTARGVPEVRAELRRYYAAREARFDSIGSVFRSFEEAHERMEGIATVIGYEAARIVTNSHVSITDRVVLENLSRVWSGVAPGETDPWTLYSRWHVYVAGAAKVRLLDRYGDSWRALATSGHTLDDLVIDRFLR